MRPRPAAAAEAAAAAAAEAAHEEPHISHAAELGLMAFSVMIALHRHLAGVSLLRAEPGDGRPPEGALRGRAQPALQQVLRRRALRRDVHQGHDEELVRAVDVRSARRRRRRQRLGLDDGVLRRGSRACIDRYVVDGAVNLVGRSSEESSFVFRRVQTGLVQNYALLMLAGVFAFVSIYLLVR